MNNVRSKLHHIYTSQIGVHEATGHNDGPEVEKYLRYTHLGPGNSWCAAFVNWSLHEAGLKNPGNAWAPALFPKKRLVAGLPQPGDIFGIYFTNLKRIGHCGFVESWDGTWCTTVEGNTTNPIRAGPGEGVYRKKRLVKTIYQVSNWVDNH